MTLDDLPRSAHAALAYATRLRSQPWVALKAEHNALLGPYGMCEDMAQAAVVSGTVRLFEAEYVRRDPRVAAIYRRRK